MYITIRLNRNSLDDEKHRLKKVLPILRDDLNHETIELILTHIDQTFDFEKNTDEIRLLLSTYVYLISEDSVIPYTTNNFTTIDAGDFEALNRNLHELNEKARLNAAKREKS
ncbi:hypothetical protein ACFOU2_02405 [Bacillus songklensis]|uniref:Uncharacterized protein n=1 Tax=Bacillus songklensis TaxID=1069116 RepID=A0ABV8AZP8_9BACI